MTTLKPQTEQRFTSAVREAGLPPDSLARFVAAGYIPQPKQMSFHAAARACDLPGGPTDIGFGGARGGGKSRAVICQLALDDCQRVPELKALFLRKIGKAARESFEDLRRQSLMMVPHEYKSHAGYLELPNKSRVILGHFRTEKEIDNYLGLEYDVIVIEEDTQLSASKKRDIETCLRTSKTNWRPRTYRTTNPGGVDHKGFKERFVLPYRRGQETTTRFIPANVYDNRFVNADYRLKLEQLAGWKRRAWLQGDWDIEAGQFFSNWDYDRLVVKPFDVPKHWPMWLSLDYGFRHPTAVYWFAESDGVIYVVDEHVEAQRLTPYHAAVIKERTQLYGRTIEETDGVFAGADCFAQKGDSHALTIADQYMACGVQLWPAAIDRVTGWSEIMRRFGDPELRQAPTLQIFDRCQGLIDCLPNLQHNPKRPEDVLKVDADPETGEGGDDEADSLRYGVMHRYRTPRPQPRDSAFGKAVFEDNWY